MDDDYSDNRRKDEEYPEQLDRFLEETAAEAEPLNREIIISKNDKPLAEEQTENTKIAEKSYMGIAALVLSLLSLLFMPLILGAAGIVVGLIAKRRGTNTMGNWAIAIGAISIVVSLFISPFI